jgi:integrase
MTTRRRRAGVEDRWTKADGTESASHGSGRRWRARYVDARGREHAKGFDRKTDAARWLDSQTAAIVDGRHVAPRDAQITVAAWCERWLAGYQGRRERSVDCARDHLRWIIAEFGDMPLSAVLPSDVKIWVAKLQAQELSATYVHAVHGRLSQICSDAVHDGLLGRNPCSRRTSPPIGKAKIYCATTEQVWALHDAMPEHLKVAILLGAFAGLRLSEACGLRVADVDFMRGIVHPVQQWKRGAGPGAPLKTAGSDAPIPIPRNLTLMLSASVARFGSDYVVTNGKGGLCSPKVLGEVISGRRRNDRARPGRRPAYHAAIPGARDRVDGLPEGFSFHDLRHYFASALIASGADIKTVQARLRHATAAMTLDVYGHLWPDTEETTRAAISKIIDERPAVNG